MSFPQPLGIVSDFIPKKKKLGGSVNLETVKSRMSLKGASGLDG